MNRIEISDIDGIFVGNARSPEGGTGCTVIICPEGAVAGVDVRGGGPATRETDLLKPENMVQTINGVVLSGGSAYGLEAACGVMDCLEERGIGFDVGIGVVPIVCGASLFDLVVGDPKCRPDKKMGFEACVDALNGNGTIKGGITGAGTGATVGKYMGPERMMKSGLGVYAVEMGGVKIGAITALNAMGDVFDAESGEQIAGLLSEDGKTLVSTEKAMLQSIEHGKNVFTGNTTITCIVTNAILTKAQCSKLASIAHDGYARTIKPVHTSADGDTIFVMSTCRVAADFDGVGAGAAYVTAKAVNDGVYSAENCYGLKCYNDFAVIETGVL